MEPNDEPKDMIDAELHYLATENARLRAALEKAHSMMAGAMWKDGRIHVCDDSCFVRAALGGR